MPEIAMREAYGRALADYGKVNREVVVLDADTSSSTLSSYFATQFPERFFNVGIAEPCMVDMGVGFALGGMIPFVNAFAALVALRALEQIRTCVCYGKTNVKIAAGYAGVCDFKDGPTHHAITDIAIMRSLPEMTVVVPADANEAASFVKLVAEYNGPVYLRMSRSSTLPVSNPGESLEIGKGIIRKQGADVAIISCGAMLGRSMQAAELLKREGVNACVLEIHTIKPLDNVNVINVAKNTGAVVTAEEHSVLGGLGSAVAELLADSLPVPVKRIGIKDTFTCTGPDPESIMDAYGLAVSDIVEAAKAAIRKKNR